MNILIVDDMEIFRRQIKRLKIWEDSERFDLRYEASDGREALDILLEEDVDIVIADIKMPVINGLELLSEIKERSLSVETILISEHSDFKFARDAIQYGAFDYLLKPVKEEELIDVLNKLYDHIELKKEEKNRIEKLEKEVLEKLDFYYPKNEVQLISKDIFKKTSELIESVDRLVFVIDNGFFEKNHKISLLLENIYSDIVMEILDGNPWIELYLDMESLDKIILKDISSREEIYSEFKSRLLKLQKDLSRLYIWTENLRIRSIMDYILINIDDIEDINTIAEEFYLSKNHMGYIFKSELDITLGNYIQDIKMERAKKLIGNGLKNYEISEILRYSTTDYFEKIFKKNIGYTPAEYRNKIK